LRHVADALAGDHVGREPQDLLAGELHAAGGPHEPGQGVAQRRLAHAVAADDGKDAVIERQRHALQSMGAAVVDIQVPDLEDQWTLAPM